MSPLGAPPTRNIPFDAPALANKRAALELSQSEMAKLLEASSLSVYKWESGKVQPRAAQQAKNAAIQKIGKREAACSQRKPHSHSSAGHPGSLCQHGAVNQTLSKEVSRTAFSVP